MERCENCRFWDRSKDPQGCPTDVATYQNRRCALTSKIKRWDSYCQEWKPISQKGKEKT
jgi:hypothetical protein